MKKMLGIALLGASMVATAQGDPYKIKISLPADAAGAMAVLVNYDTAERVDSVLVSDEGEALFTGEVDDPFLARILVDGARAGQLIVENGSIVVDVANRTAYGSPLNDLSRDYTSKVMAMYRASQNGSPEVQENFNRQYDQLRDSVMQANLDNPFGYSLFLDYAYELSPEELNTFIAQNPSIGKYSRVQKLVEMNQKKLATSVGAKYLDFEVNGQKLSDYVAKDGKYLLVDFWASWCGPCKRQIPVIKELITKYPERLNVLGVAVWDQPDDTRKAIADHEITWPNIIDAQTIPTDIYGIPAIPCIILIAPDGTIVSRDLQGDELKAAVAAALGE